MNVVARLGLSIFALVTLVGATFYPFNVYETSQPATMRIEWSDRVCSGVAIGRYTVLTAAHCLPGALPFAEFGGAQSGYTALIDDGNDHVLLRTTQRMPHYAKISKRPMHIGDILFLWGNPYGLKQILRVGKVAAFDTASTICIDTVKPRPCSLIMYDANLTHGDSGAAIFNSRGELVGLESGGYTVEGWTMPFFYPLAFKAKQLRDAIL